MLYSVKNPPLAYLHPTSYRRTLRPTASCWPSTKNSLPRQEKLTKISTRRTTLDEPNRKK